MAQALQHTIDRLRQLAGRADIGDRSDRQLLETFARTGAESAFALLVRRHGPLVLGVCWRVLGNAEDAEDAFQATFLVLARKAGSVPWHDSIRNWLYGVAYRVARKARSLRSKRAECERQAAAQAAESTLESAWAEVRGVLDEELRRLPTKYRSPLLLCCLEGKTREEAADELGWSLGSLKGRLERGRELLRQRLAQRGLTLAAVLGTTVLTDATVSAALAAAAVQASIPFAAGNVAAATTSPIVFQLAQGVLHAMLIAKCKITGVILGLTCALGVGGSFAVREAWAERPAAAAGAIATTLQSLDMNLLEPQPIDFQERERPRDGDAKQEKGRPRDGEGRPEKERPRDGDRKPEKERPRDGERGPLGIVKKIDLKVGTITIQSLRDGDTGEKTLNLAGKEVKVISNVERPMTVADVREGVRVALTLNEKNDVTTIRVEFPMFPAFLVKADAENKTVTLRMERLGENTLKVAPDARITHSGKAIGLAGLDPEQRVLVHLTADKQTVIAIFAGERDVPRERPPVRDPGREREGTLEPGRVGGVIVEIDAAKGTIGLLVGREGNLAITTLNVSKDARVRLLHGDLPLTELKFAELTKPAQAWVTLDASQKSATALDITAPLLRLRVKHVDAAARKVTFVSERRDEQTLEFAADVKIRRGRNEVQLNDLQPGMALMVSLSLDRSKVIAATVIGDGEQGREERQ